MRLIESYGTGIGKIQRVYIGNVREPEFETAKGVFRVTLPNHNEGVMREQGQGSVREEKIPLSRQKQLILEFAAENGGITRKGVDG